MEHVKIVEAHKFSNSNNAEQSKGYTIFRRGFNPLEYAYMEGLDVGITGDEEKFLTKMQKKGWLLTTIREENDENVGNIRYYYFSNLNFFLTKKI